MSVCVFVVSPTYKRLLYTLLAAHFHAKDVCSFVLIFFLNQISLTLELFAMTALALLPLRALDSHWRLLLYSIYLLCWSSSLSLDYQSLARLWRHNWCASTTDIHMWVSGAIWPMAGLSVAVVGHHCRLQICPTAVTTHRRCWLLFSCTLIFWDFQQAFHDYD